MCSAAAPTDTQLPNQRRQRFPHLSKRPRKSHSVWCTRSGSYQSGSYCSNPRSSSKVASAFFESSGYWTVQKQTRMPDVFVVVRISTGTRRKFPGHLQHEPDQSEALPILVDLRERSLEVVSPNGDCSCRVSELWGIRIVECTSRRKSHARLTLNVLNISSCNDRNSSPRISSAA